MNLYGAGNFASKKKSKTQINYNLKASFENFELYATDEMHFILDLLYDIIRRHPNDRKRICDMLEQYGNMVASLAESLIKGAYDEDFLLRYPDFDPKNSTHYEWLTESLMPGEVRALMSMSRWCKRKTP